MRTIRPTSAVVSAMALVTALLLVLSAAGAASVQDVVEKYGLTGTWAADCTKPADRENPHVVYRLLDPDRLQRETMIVPDRNLDVSVALSIVETGPGELTMVWKTGDGGITNRVRASQGRMQVLDSTRETGEKLIANGRRTHDNAEAPTFNKCA